MDPKRWGQPKAGMNLLISSTTQTRTCQSLRRGMGNYAITYSPQSSADADKTMEILAEVSGGKYYNASTKNALIEVYQKIASDLKTEAGVNTTMNVVFENVEVDGKLDVPGKEVFDYVYAPPNSTQIYSYFSHDNSVITGPYDRDDTENWTASPPHLPFEIGTIRLNQTWEATFRLNVTKSGNINIFGLAQRSHSTTAKVLKLPIPFIRAIPQNNTGITSPTLAVRFTEPNPGSGPYTDVVPLNWTTTYDGDQSVEVSLTRSLQDDRRLPSVFFQRTLPPQMFADKREIANSTVMDVRDLVPGNYSITVTASADNNDAKDMTYVWVHTKDASPAYIKIS